jgi:hypothetical protein
MPIDGWPVGIVVVPAGVDIEVVVVLVVPVIGGLDWVVIENERAPPSPMDVLATVRCRKSLEADMPPSAGSGDAVPVPRWLAIVFEKVVGDPLLGAVDAETPSGVAATPRAWWLWALAVCPWCVTAWVTAAAIPCWPAALAVCP